MRAIEFFRLRRVRDKPRALAAIAAHAGLSPPEALRVLHAAVGGGRPVLHLPDDAAARACILALAPTGFVARFALAGDGDLAQAVAAALLQARLPPAVSDAAGALLLAGEPAAALEHGLLHLRAHAAPADAARALLERTATEVGLMVGVPSRA